MLHRTRALWLSLGVLYKVIVTIIYLTFTLPVVALRDVESELQRKFRVA